MTLESGARLGPYEIDSAAGAGGMGEVYRARDTRLQRTVALKILSPHLASDPAFRQRFEREARAISALNHPHICTLHDIGHQDGIDYLVMEYVEGESLASRLEKGPLPLDRVLRHGVEIANALDRAHRHGIVHRDLKPGNIMLTRSGVKLLDFGLAKLRAEPVQMMDGATRTTPLTGHGTVLGTLHYMAPEQLEAKEADARTDIFSFGVVLYEMATGRKPFSGSSQASLISAIMSSEPAALTEFQPLAPAALDRVVRKCLAKDPDERWQTARDLADELAWIAAQEPTVPGKAAVARPPHRQWLAWGTAALATVAATGLAAAYFTRPAPAPGPVVRFSIPLPQSASTRNFEIRSDITGAVALSPDARHLVLQVMAEGRSRLWIRSLDDTGFRVIAGTEGAFSPFWSPDSRYIGFAADGKLKKVEVGGGAPAIICDARVETVPTWGHDGTILFTEDVGVDGSIWRVSADGGTKDRVTLLDRSRGHVSHMWPHFLPDGRRFLFVALEGRHQKRTYVGSLDGSPPLPIADRGSRVMYVESGHLLYVNRGTLVAQPFDLAALQPRGEPLSLVDGVQYFEPTGDAEFSVSNTGVLTYQTVANFSPNLVWFDRSGRPVGDLTMPGPIKSLRMAPDGQRFAVDVIDPRTGTSDIWIHDLSRNVPERFTYEATDEVNPIWVDGTRIVFRSDRGGPPDIHAKAVEGAGEEEVIFANKGVQHPHDVSLDGRELIFTEEDRTRRADLWILPLSGSARPRPFLQTPFEERDAVFSHDGAWIAFESDESGAPEVYVAPIDAPRSRRRVSAAGGQTPRWRRNGRELFYLTERGVVMRVPFTPGRDPEIGPAMPLFTTGGPVANNIFDVSPDGERFLVNVAVDDDRAPITVLLDWVAALDR